MKRTCFFLSISACLIAVVAGGVGQDSRKPLQLIFTARPVLGGNIDLIKAQSDAGTGLKLWSYKIASTRKGSKGKEFEGVMVGGDPFTSKGTTTITMQIVPLIFDIQGTIFDPTVPDNNCAGGKVPLTLVQESPLVVPTDFTMNGVKVGKAQYTDAFRRASFWQPVSKNGGTYHNKLNVVTLDPIKINPGKHGSIVTRTSCGALGGVGYFWFTSYVEHTLIPQLQQQGKINPTTFPFFLLYNVAIPVSGQCCVGGWHGGIGSPVQTYGAALFDTTGAFGAGYTTYGMAHEIAEWQDDPLYGFDLNVKRANPTPPWGHVGQVPGCQHNTEVGDPLTGTAPIRVTMPNGFTYDLQEFAYFSWFFGPPSIGAGGKFSSNGTFTSTQASCKK
jgi:hypothetical protein